MALFNPFRKRRDNRQRELAKLVRQKLNATPKDISLYVLAMRHKSAARNILNKPEECNERLEFLGDAILDSVVAEHLYHAHPKAEEGELTQMKSRIVSRANLNRMAKRMGVDARIETDLQASNSRTSIAGNALEALVGALYLDLGYAKTTRSIAYILDRFADLELLEEKETDFKSRLYEEAHRTKKHLRFDTDTAELTKGNPRFVSKAVLEGKDIGRGEGTSKKKAEQNAAGEALRALGLLDA